MKERIQQELTIMAQKLSEIWVYDDPEIEVLLSRAELLVYQAVKLVGKK